MAAEMDKTFEKLIETIVEHEKKVSEAEQNQSDPRPWLNFSNPTMKNPAQEKTEEELHETLSRKDAEDKYIEALSKEDGKLNELAAPKIQADFLAAVERDKRMQWRSRIRIAAHCSSRCAGHGNDKGAVRVKTLEYISRILLKAEDYQRDE